MPSPSSQVTFQIDYVRLYQKIDEQHPPRLSCSPPDHPSAGWVRGLHIEYGVPHDPSDPQLIQLDLWADNLLLGLGLLIALFGSSELAFVCDSVQGLFLGAMMFWAILNLLDYDRGVIGYIFVVAYPAPGLIYVAVAHMLAGLMNIFSSAVAFGVVVNEIVWISGYDFSLLGFWLAFGIVFVVLMVVVARNSVPSPVLFSAGSALFGSVAFTVGAAELAECQWIDALYTYGQPACDRGSSGALFACTLCLWLVGFCRQIMAHAYRGNMALGGWLLAVTSTLGAWGGLGVPSSPKRAPSGPHFAEARPAAVEVRVDPAYSIAESIIPEESSAQSPSRPTTERSGERRQDSGAARRLHRTLAAFARIAQSGRESEFPDDADRQLKQLRWKQLQKRLKDMPTVSWAPIGPPCPRVTNPSSRTLKAVALIPCPYPCPQVGRDTDPPKWLSSRASGLMSDWEGCTQLVYIEQTSAHVKTVFGFQEGSLHVQSGHLQACRHTIPQTLDGLADPNSFYLAPNPNPALPNFAFGLPSQPWSSERRTQTVSYPGLAEPAIRETEHNRRGADPPDAP